MKLTHEITHNLIKNILGKARSIKNLNTEYCPEEELMKRIAMDFSEYERKMIGARTIAGLRHKAKQGIYPCKAALGYKNTKDDSGVRIIIIDSEKARYIKQAYELLAKGKSVKEITEKLYNDGFRNTKGKKVPSLRIKQILQDPMYIGKFHYLGKLYDGTHQPIVSNELFDKVQEKLSK